MVICAFMGRPWYEGGLAGGGSGPGRGEGSSDR